jgi:hypothetical protein
MTCVLRTLSKKKELTGKALMPQGHKKALPINGKSLQYDDVL